MNKTQYYQGWEKRSWFRALFLTLLLLAILSGLLWRFFAIQMWGELNDEQVYGSYTVRTYRREFPMESYEILKDGKRIYAERDGTKYTIGSDNCLRPNPLLAMGKDITGDGVPNLVICQKTGMAEVRITIFNLGDELHKLAMIEANYGGRFCDLDGDTNLEFATGDGAPFLFWKGCCHADSPMPRIVLRYSRSSYHLAVDQMLSAPPNRETLVKLAKSLRSDKRWHSTKLTSKLSFEEELDRISVQADLAEAVLDVIYSGHLKLGWELFDMAWPENVPDKKETCDRLKRCLDSSRYLMELQALWGQNKEEEKN